MEAQYQIVRTISEEGQEQWTVSRRDGKSFGDGWLGLNFSIDDWQLAIDCRKKLEG